MTRASQSPPVATRPWEWVADPHELRDDAWRESSGLVSPDEVAPDTWLRVIPTTPELATLTGRPIKGDDGLPQPRPLRLDRKLWPDGDLFDAKFAPHLVCSERLARALELAGATGWRAEPVAHPTPHDVQGAVPYRLEVTGQIGPVADTVSEPERGEDDDEPAVDGLWGEPLPPVTIDGAGWSGGRIGWSGWVELGARPWRALLVRADLARALVAGDDPCDLAFAPVTVRGLDSNPSSKSAPGTWTAATATQPIAADLPGLVEHLRATAGTFEHLIPPPPSPRALRAAADRSGLAPDHPLLELLALTHGAVLFGGALAWVHVGDAAPVGVLDVLEFDVGSLYALSSTRTFESGGVDVSTQVVLFARSHAGEVFWGITPDGRVRGYGTSGHVYGPNAPLARWLRDFVYDGEFVWPIRDDELWADAMING